MNEPPVFILWDASGIWGLMALRALRFLDINCVLVRGKDIAQGALAGKRHEKALLIVPGGSARQKLASLKGEGQKELLNWLRGGGEYIGFCGGAGLALADGLGICPLEREPYAHRLFHLLSGHVIAESAMGKISLPVWWPGRFSWKGAADIDIQAIYKTHDKDLFIADLPFDLMPPKIIKRLEQQTGQPTKPIFPANQPLALSGRFGKGQYFLSYAHLETPESGDANAWLEKILHQYNPRPLHILPPWNTRDKQEFSNEISTSFHASMQKSARALREMYALGEKTGLFFPRASWLFGWRPGFPGMGLNNLLACLDTLANLPACTPAPRSWPKIRIFFESLMNNFIEEGTNCLWNLKLQIALNHLHHNLKHPVSADRTETIFGSPLHGKGMITKIASLCDLWLFELQEWLFRDH